MNTPWRLCIHLSFHAHDSLGIWYATVVSCIVNHLRHEEIERCESHYKPYEVQHCCRLETASHIHQIFNDNHSFNRKLKWESIYY